MNTRKVFAIPLLLLWASNAIAVPCTSSVSLGSLGPPGVGSIGNSFRAVGTFTDCYTFSLGGAADLAGFTVQSDPLSYLDIETTLSLFEGDSLLGSTTGNQLGSTFTVGAFSFSGLTAGIYSLVTENILTVSAFGLSVPVGYAGQLTAISTALPPVDPETPPTSVPEPGTLALLLVALAGAGVTRRRRER